MDRNEFMELVYETFADEPDNVLANGIIEAADAYAEHEKAQLSQEGTTFDTISRQAAIDAVRASYDEILDFKSTGRTVADSVEDIISKLPAAKSEYYWREFKTRPLTEEEKEMYPNIDRLLDCELPKNGQKILITVNEPGHEPVQTDVFCDDGECSLDSLYEIGTEATAWMPSPEPYKPNEKQGGKEGA